jgi:aryl-alcohol dehydrogenase-like predicted oxidoreductase
VPLASNQIQYSLLYRTPEANGVIDACREAGATVIAYSPLAQGLLTGLSVCTASAQHPHNARFWGLSSSQLGL